MTQILISCITMQTRLNGCGKLMSVAGSAGPAKAEANAHGISLGTARCRFHNQGLSFLIPFPGGSGGRHLSLILQSSGLSCAKKSPANVPTFSDHFLPRQGLHSLPRNQAFRRTRPCDPPSIERQSRSPRWAFLKATRALANAQAAIRHGHRRRG
jgi:hypothetical protein